jgi:hypothetical protein
VALEVDVQVAEDPEDVPVEEKAAKAEEVEQNVIKIKTTVRLLHRYG